MRRGSLILTVAITLTAGSTRAQTEGSSGEAPAGQRKRLPRVIARALGIVTSTVAQTSAQPAPRTPRNYYSLIPEPLLVAELEARHAVDGPFHARVERVSRGLLGAPYLLGALGEGDGARPDPDPRFRLDAFDCTTLVETTLALSHADHPTRAAILLDRIRYAAGEVDFEARRHLMTSQWIPGLVDEGWLRDVTRSVGGRRTEEIALELTEARWANRHIARALVLPEARVPKGTFPLPYLPTRVALEAVDRFPPGAIINVVRRDWSRAPDVVTHQGIVIVHPGGKRRYVRHASPLAKRVVDEPLDRMLERYSKRPGRWSVVGINVLEIRPAPPPTGSSGRDF